MTDLLDAIARLDSAVIYLVVFGLALGETAILADMFVPGEVGLLVASAAAAQADLPVVPLWLAAAAGATLGDFISYLIGRRLGESRWMKRHTGKTLQRGVDFVRRHGGGAVFVGRWIGALRAVVPFVAGSARMELRRFLPFNVAASLTWAGAVVVLGYHLGPGAARWVDRFRWGLLAAAALALTIMFLVKRHQKGPLVDASFLKREVVIADVRFYLDGRSTREAYDAGHIPGAVYVDLSCDLVGPGRGRHPLPPPEKFAEAMAALGIGDGAVVVAYDDASGSIAARLWWMLDAQGQEAYVLDGGWPGPWSTDPVVPEPVDPMPVKPWPRVVDADGAAAAPVVLDARAAERYRGEVEPVDPRAGHVPGALSAPWPENVGPDGRFLPPDALAERYKALHADAGPVVYCGSGVTACHDLLALRVAGLKDGVLYDGSWSDWSSDPAREVRTGPIP
jgi:thiosulfate/3-mercaptopyruvate sulfurtransferase